MPLIERTLEGLKAKVGLDHPFSLTFMSNLAGAYSAAGRADLAGPLYAEVLVLRKAKLGVDHPKTKETAANLAGAYRDAGQPAMALPVLRELMASSPSWARIVSPRPNRSYWRGTREWSNGVKRSRLRASTAFRTRSSG